jgi:hypothetical protein
MSIQFFVHQDDGNEEAYTEMLSEALTELKTIDPTVELLPWWPDSTEPTITNPNQIPVAMSKMRLYFDRLYLPRNWPTGKTTYSIWTSIYIVSKTKVDEYITGLKHWRHKVYERHLQCPRTAVAYWGLYSTSNMDTQLLQKHFHTKHNLSIAVRWRALTMSKTSEVEYKDKPKALHFEVDSRELDKASEILQREYALAKKDSKAFPCGYRLRMVPDLNAATVTQQPRVEAMINRQDTFQKMTTTVTVFWRQGNLDYFHPNLNLTLRQVLTDAAPHYDPSNRTFLAVSRRNANLQGDCLLVNEHRANEVMKNIVPYMRHYVKNEFIFDEGTELTEEDQERIIDTYFPPELVAASKNRTWDPNTDGVVTSYDPYLDDVTHSDDLFEFDTEIARLLPPEPTPQETHIIDILHGTGNDSIGTFGQQSAITPHYSPHDSIDTPMQDTQSVAGQSAYTQLSLQSLQSELTRHVDEELSKKFAKQREELETEFKHLASSITREITESVRHMLQLGQPPGQVTLSTQNSTTTPSTLTPNTARNTSPAMPIPPGTGPAGEPP